MKKRFHVFSLPHTATTREYNCCAYTGKVIRFCSMMKSLGHHVTLYAAKDNEAECDELIVCSVPWPIDEYCNAPFEENAPHWKLMNALAIESARLRVQEKDFLCFIGGACQKPIAREFPSNMSVEFGIGYGGTFAPYRVFESYAWMHAVYGQDSGACQANGRAFDEVIPNYFDIRDFPFRPMSQKQKHLLYLGRIIPRKGVQVAIDLIQRCGGKLVIAGPGSMKGVPDPGEIIKGETWVIERVRPVNIQERGVLLSNAKAVIVPTQYIEPFGGVAIESMLCGTPVITTDWGAFTEYVENGVNGYRCRTLSDFCDAWKKINLLDNVDSATIRAKAIKRFSMENVAKQYENYFERLLTLWDKGWYA